MSRDKRQAWADKRKKRQQEQEGTSEAKRCFIDATAMEKHGITAYVLGKKKHFLVLIAHEDDDISYELNIHYGVGVDNKQFLCPRDAKDACPICEKFADIKAKHQREGREFGDEDAWEELKPFYVNRKSPHHLLLVRDLALLDKGEEAPLQYIILPESVAGPTGDLCELCFDPSSDNITCIPTDPVDGKDFFFETIDKGGFTNYKRFRLLDRSDKKGAINYLKEYPDWYENIPRHSELIHVPDYDEIASELTGFKSSKPDADDDDGSNGEPRGRRRRNPDDADEEKSDDDDSDTPRGRLHDNKEKEGDGDESSGRRSSSHEEPKDTDKDDNDDEPDERPRRRRRSSSSS